VRGELTLLEMLIERLGPTDSDLLLFLGSYLGPGPDSKGVVEYILDLQKRLSGKVLCLRGCYEYVFQFAIEENVDDETAKFWSKMDGEKVFESYAVDKSVYVTATGNNGAEPKPMKVAIPMLVPETHIRFMENLHQWYEDDIFPYIGCHSGGHPGLFGGRLEDESQTVFSEDGWWEQKWRRIPNKTVVFSHVPFRKPFRGPGKIGIDLGCGLGGKLCAFELFAENFTTVGHRHAK